MRFSILGLFFRAGKHLEDSSNASMSLLCGEEREKSVMLGNSGFSPRAWTVCADLVRDVALTDPERQAGQVASASVAGFLKLIQHL